MKPSEAFGAETFAEMLDFGAIKRLIGPRKRHVVNNCESAKELKQRPIDGDLEQLLDETREKRDQLQQHLSVYQSLRTQLEEVAKNAGKKEYDKVMEDYDDYADLALEAELTCSGTFLENENDQGQNVI